MMSFNSIFLSTSLILAMSFISNRICAIGVQSIPFVENYDIVDYEKSENWAALPTKQDSADLTPKDLATHEKPFDIDVFFLYPTSFTKADERWNATIDDAKINEKTDNASIKFQASIFNKTGKVYAPRYRQAHIKAYFSKDHESARQALDFAYQDVRAAFIYYLEHYNNGRPFILASHSQGTTHAQRLIKEFIDKKPLQKQLIAAYLVGLPVLKNSFYTIKPCLTPEETGCFCSWRTYKTGYEPKTNIPFDEIAVINPITWTTGLAPADKSLHKGSVLADFNQLKPKSQTAQIYKGVILTNKPKFRGSFLFTSKNYHVGDYNIFYRDVQENSRLRAKTYLQTQQGN